MLKTERTPRGVFITGTNTGVGKTLISSLVSAYFKNKYPLCYFKPVQTGTEEFVDAETMSDTQSVVQRAALNVSEYREPIYNFKLPASPDRAAEAEGQVIDPTLLITPMREQPQTFFVVEGAGGVEVPLKKGFRMTDLMREISLPVVIVSSPRLGTINHTLLTWNQLKVSGVSVAGVVISGEGDPGLENVLRGEGLPVLGRVPFFKETLDATKMLENNAVQECLKNLESAIAPSSIDSFWETKDENYVWHPFTQHKIEKNFPVIVRGRGSKVITSKGEELIDATSSWWVNLHGHGHPEMVRAIAEQASRLEHVIFSGYTHQPAIELSDILLRETQTVNPQLSKVFYSDNGSTAVEVALKIAYQYHILKGEPRTRFLALTNSYHGDTVGAMSVSDPLGYHQYFRPLMMPVDHIAVDDDQELERIFPDLKNYAACIVEPLLQGAGGMKMYSAVFLQKLQKYCREQGVLLIADEIFTGFYRTGTFLASEQAQWCADLVCLSKGITGGFLPLSATVVTENIYEMFLHNTKAKAFLHGHSYTANPIACAAAVKSYEILKRPETQKNISRLAESTTRCLVRIKEKFPNDVFNPRSLGTIGAFEFNTHEDYFTPDVSRQIVELCFTQGVLLRPLGQTIYTVPPYCTTDRELETIYNSVENAMSHVIHKGE